MIKWREKKSLALFNFVVNLFFFYFIEIAKSYYSKILAFPDLVSVTET
jgi:hypothetical protein